MKKVALFVRKGLLDIFQPNRFGVSDLYPYSNTWPYGLDYTAEGMARRYGIEFDTNGIPMMQYDVKQRRRTAGKWYYHPLKIAHYALASYNDYLKKGDETCLDQFRTNVQHLQEIAEEGPEKGVVWRVPRSLPRYGTPDGHVSAIVQGLVISALCRSYVIDKNELHLDLARRAKRVLRVPVEKGGVLSRSRWGPMYEEYPSLPYSHVINGFIFCLMGLYDLKKIAGDTEAEQLLQEGCQALKSVIPSWVEESWSKYDLRDITNEEVKNYATLHYQILHYDQMEVMKRITEKNIFEECKKRLKIQSKSKKFLAKVYANKVKKFII